MPRPQRNRAGLQKLCRREPGLDYVILASPLEGIQARIWEAPTRLEDVRMIDQGTLRLEPRELDIRAMVALLAMRDSVVPPTINLDTPDPECDLDYVPNVARPMPVDVAMVNAFGFGGQNVVTVFTRGE